MCRSRAVNLLWLCFSLYLSTISTLKPRIMPVVLDLSPHWPLETQQSIKCVLAVILTTLKSKFFSTHSLASLNSSFISMMYNVSRASTIVAPWMLPATQEESVAYFPAEGFSVRFIQINHDFKIQFQLIQQKIESISSKGAISNSQL